MAFEDSLADMVDKVRQYEDQLATEEATKTAIIMPSLPSGRELMVSRPTAPSEGSASPRKPKEWIFSRSEPSIFDVAWRESASGRSSAVIPQPSSVTRIRDLPPSA